MHTQLNHAFPILCNHSFRLPRDARAMSTYGERLGVAMEFSKAERKTLADGIGVTVQAIGQVLSGKSTAFSAYNSARAARFLGVSDYWLATGQGKMIEDPPSYRFEWPFRRLSRSDIRTLKSAGKLGEVESFALGLLSALPTDDSKSNAG